MKDLCTNAFLINFPFESFQVERIPYESEVVLSELRNNHNKTHSFFRDSDYIYFSPMEKEKLDYQSNIITLSVNEDRSVVAKLLRHIFFRTFISNFPNVLPSQFYPFTIFSTQDQHDLAQKFLPDKLKRKISFKRQIRIHTRNILTSNSNRFAFVPEISHRWGVSISIKEMHEMGFSVKGLQVLYVHNIPGYEQVFAPDESLIGQILTYDENQATVQTNSGTVSYSLDQLRVRHNVYEIKKFLSFVVGDKKADDVITKILSHKRKNFPPTILLNEINILMKNLSQLNFKNEDSFFFTIDSTSYTTNSTFLLGNTSLCFDPTPGSVDSSANRGLQHFGPYDSQYFTPKDPHILVICQKSHRGRVSEFLGILQSGISNSSYYPNGMNHLLRLHRVKFSVYETDGVSPSDYEKAIDSALESPDNHQFDGAIVVAKESWKNLIPMENPYIRSKAKLMTAGIPVQSVKDSNVKGSPSQLQFLLTPFIVQLYAKIGGIPWVLPAKSNVDVELVIGLGTKIIRPNMWAKAAQSKFVGITMFFKGNGQYLLSKKSKPVPYDSYFKMLLSNLKSQINSLSLEYRWDPGTTIRLIFHAHKPFRNIEANAVSQIAEAFPEFNITYAFVRISTYHPLILLRNIKSKNGMTDLTQRGDNLRLNSHQALIQLKSPIKNKFSRPILITLHDESSFSDLHYISQQILNFSYLNWRSILPTTKPITVFYSELLADLSTKLDQIENWNATSLESQTIRKGLWFL